MLFRGALGGGAASGKLGALVASHNSGGQYLRSRVTPTNTNTPQQQEVRNAFRTLSPQWATSLSETQRNAWETYAANVTRKNKLGDSIKLSGISTFLAYNAPRIQAGLSIITAAPTIFDLGDAGTPGTITLQPLNTGGTITYAGADPWVTENGSNNHMLLYLSRPQNIGKRFFAGPYQLAAVIAANTTGISTFTNPFAVGATGTQRVFAQYRISRKDGRLSSPLQISATP